MVDFSNRDIAGFLKRYLAEIEAGNAAIFAGAGLSKPAGYVDWRDLLREIADDLDIRIDLESDLVAVAQWHFNKANNRSRLNKAIIDHLSMEKDPTPNHLLLARLPIATWWTTNYDKLPEKAFERAGKIVDVKSDHRQLANTKPRRDTILYKMHGDVDRPDTAVVMRDDYERYARDRAPFVSALAGDLVSKTFLFVGFSFTDPNLDQVLSRVRLTLDGNTREHFAFFKRRTRKDGEDEEAYIHDRARQELVIKDLGRYGVTVILLDEYTDLDEILQELERRYRRQTVFVSASADDFEPWGQPAVEQFMRALGDALVTRRIRIATGLGLGVGNALLTGAVERVLGSRMGHIEDTLIIRPFPQHKQMGSIEEQPLLSSNKWEEVKKGGDEAIKKWIGDNMKGKSCLVVLVGEKTAGRKWVNYEIKKAWEDGLGVVAIRIHNLADSKGNQVPIGGDPFVGLTVNGVAVNPSPVVLRYDARPQPIATSDGKLRAMFADALPDGWTRRLLDERLLEAGYDPAELSQLDRLSLVGGNGLGALSFRPSVGLEGDVPPLTLADLAATVLRTGSDGDAGVAVAERLTGSLGGARAKASIWMRDGEPFAVPVEQATPWIAKFPTPGLDRSDAGPIEYAYSLMARAAGVDMPRTTLLEMEGGPGVFAIERFDREGAARFHFQSMAGLLDLLPLERSSYANLFAIAEAVTDGRVDREQMARRMIFNVIARNRDDHTRNHGFLMNAEGSWIPSPAYDVTFSPLRAHELVVGANAADPGPTDMRRSIEDAGWGGLDVDDLVADVTAVVDSWPDFAREAGVSKDGLETVGRAVGGRSGGRAAAAAHIAAGGWAR